MRYSNFSQVRLYVVPMEEQEEIARYLDEIRNDIQLLEEDMLHVLRKGCMTGIHERYASDLIREFWHIEASDSCRMIKYVGRDDCCTLYFRVARKM